MSNLEVLGLSNDRKEGESVDRLIRIANGIQDHIRNQDHQSLLSYEALGLQAMFESNKFPGDPQLFNEGLHLNIDEFSASPDLVNVILITNREFEMKNNQPDWKPTVSKTVTFWAAGKDSTKRTYEQILHFPELKAGHTLAYVHGFDNSVDTAVQAASDLGAAVQDSNVTNIICFSWPSHYRIDRYDYDVLRAKDSVPALEALFFAVHDARVNPSTDRLHLLAHSLGNRLSIAALVSATKHHKDRVSDLFGCLFFAAADVDIDSDKTREGFQHHLSSLAPSADSVTSYACDSDRALWYSSGVNLAYRGGRYAPVACGNLGEYTTLLWRGNTGVDWANHNSFKTKQVHDDINRAIMKDSTRKDHWSAVQTGEAGEDKNHDTKYYADHRVFFIHKQ